MKKVYAYTVYIGHLPVLKTNDRKEAYDRMALINVKRPKAPVRVHSIISAR